MDASSKEDTTASGISALDKLKERVDSKNKRKKKNRMTKKTMSTVPNSEELSTAPLAAPNIVVGTLSTMSLEILEKLICCIQSSEDYTAQPASANSADSPNATFGSDLPLHTVISHFHLDNHGTGDSSMAQSSPWTPQIQRLCHNTSCYVSPVHLPNILLLLPHNQVQPDVPDITAYTSPLEISKSYKYNLCPGKLNIWHPGYYRSCY